MLKITMPQYVIVRHFLKAWNQLVNWITPTIQSIVSSNCLSEVANGQINKQMFTDRQTPAKT